MDDTHADKYTYLEAFVARIASVQVLDHSRCWRGSLGAVAEQS